jgi:hypothetical protein
MLHLGYTSFGIAKYKGIILYNRNWKRTRNRPLFDSASYFSITSYRELIDSDSFVC